MNYLLDISVITDFVKGQPETMARIKNISPLDLAISSITLFEIKYGLLLNPQRAKKITAVVDSFLAAVKVLPVTAVDAVEAATLRLSIHKKNIQMDEYDVLLAGLALNNNLIVVTSNEAIFTAIPKLKIENWRAPLPQAEGSFPSSEEPPPV